MGIKLDELITRRTGLDQQLNQISEERRKAETFIENAKSQTFAISGAITILDEMIAKLRDEQEKEAVDGEPTV